MSAATASSTAPAPRRRPGSAAFVALYRVVLRHQVTAARLLLLAALGAIAVLVAAALAAQASDPIVSATRFVSAFGLGLVVPVGSLMLASAALGDPVEDETLVYLWLRPTSRWSLALAAWAGSLTATLPLLAIPLTAAAAIASRGDTGVVVGTLAATSFGVVAYTAVFTLVGLVLRRALLWGLVYVFIWEFFVARASSSAARLSINSYLGSVLADSSGVPLRLADRSPVASVVVPLAVAGVALVLTVRRLQRAEVP